MSKNKGFSSTSANRYSLALYELASEKNLLAKVEENLRKLRTQFKEGLEQKLEKIAKNPKKNPRTLIKKLVDKQLLEMEE